MPLMRSRITRRAAGFTLIEVLMTLMVMSVGLLGLAAMQVVGMKSSGTANYRSVAALVAGEMAERMRSNPVALGAGTFRNITGGSLQAQCTSLPTTYCSSHIVSGSVVPAADCNPAALADYDINVMYCGEVTGPTASNRASTGLKMLPSGQMTITCAANPCPLGTQHIIKITWDETPQDGGAAIPRSLVVNFTPLS